AAERVREQVPPGVGSVEDEADGWSLLVVGGDDPDWLAAHLARLPFDLEILDPPELHDAAGRMAARLAALAGPTAG
ncbi:MAG: WYL domain-containing protein, partial [Actinomycetota bacterium]|nr:WYL domain-containing protein [Actinomycetota bacterium]